MLFYCDLYLFKSFNTNLGGSGVELVRRVETRRSGVNLGLLAHHLLHGEDVQVDEAHHQGGCAPGPSPHPSAFAAETKSIAQFKSEHFTKLTKFPKKIA